MIKFIIWGVCMWGEGAVVNGEVVNIPEVSSSINSEIHFRSNDNNKKKDTVKLQFQVLNPRFSSTHANIFLNYDDVLKM